MSWGRMGWGKPGVNRRNDSLSRVADWDGHKDKDRYVPWIYEESE
jgi:hypothetical protein